MEESIPEELYATIAGDIDDQLVQRVFVNMATAINGGVKIANIIIQSNGGFVGSGISLYNYLKGVPITINTYNTGSISSIAVPVFLAGETRKACTTATFMIHKTHMSPGAGTTGAQLHAIANSLLLDDSRSESILREHLSLPENKWAEHASGAPLTVSASEAKEWGFIDEIEDFVLPPGTQIYNI